MDADNKPRIIRGYHYTNDVAYGEMKKISYLTPVSNYPGRKENVTFGFLEKEPNSWIQSKEFPNIWNELLEHLCYNAITSGADNLIVLGFDIIQGDEAYVIDRGIYERGTNNARNPWDIESFRASRDYRISRILVDEYNGEHELPELVIHNCIPLERLRIESKICIKSLENVEGEVKNLWGFLQNAS
ncbi:hypothetical protein HOD75_02830 [archaeon]|jgi:hypothetical protein|nr:hypothetical protein [archaeon]MBT4241809.1 hypothetical protein [archaeon]MBT4418357.1 hypothetical protein [archaeon]